MNQSVKIVSALLSLIIGTASAYAEPGHRRGERAQGDDQWSQRQDRPHRAQDDQYAREPVPAPEPRRRGNMSPEERRALRQQIHDAGRDVYPPGR